jgi:hypothetical protein
VSGPPPKRSHPLPSGGRHYKKPPPSGDSWLPTPQSLRLPSVAIRCQAVDGAIKNLHRLATGGYERQVATDTPIPPPPKRSHPLPSGGQHYKKPPPSGDRWLPTPEPSAAKRSHPLPSGGHRNKKPPPSGDRWLPIPRPLRLPNVAIRCQAVDSTIKNLHRLATGGYERQVATSDRWLRATGGYRQPGPSAIEALSLFTTIRAQTTATKDLHSEKAP